MPTFIHKKYSNKLDLQYMTFDTYSKLLKIIFTFNLHTVLVLRFLTFLIFVHPGRPTCRCAVGFTGVNCERRVCDNHCLNGGTCEVSTGNQPTCRCLAEYTGDRCLHRESLTGPVAPAPEAWSNAALGPIIPSHSHGSQRTSPSWLRWADTSLASEMSSVSNALRNFQSHVTCFCTIGHTHSLIFL